MHYQEVNFKLTALRVLKFLKLSLTTAVFKSCLETEVYDLQLILYDCGKKGYKLLPVKKPSLITGRVSVGTEQVRKYTINE